MRIQQFLRGLISKDTTSWGQTIFCQIIEKHCGWFWLYNALWGKKTPRFTKLHWKLEHFKDKIWSDLNLLWSLWIRKVWVTEKRKQKQSWLFVVMSWITLSFHWCVITYFSWGKQKWFITCYYQTNN